MIDEIILVIMCGATGYIIGHAHAKRKSWKKGDKGLANYGKTQK